MATIRPNKVKQKLAAGQTVISLAGIDSPDLVDQVGPAGPDAIWLEAEHGPIDFGRIPDLTRACDLWGMTSVVRVNALDYGTIYRTLDLGAQGICVPHIDTADHARAVRRGGQVRADRQARPVHEPPGLRRARLSLGRQRPDAADRPDRGHPRGREPRCDPRGRPHRRVLRRALRPRGLHGPDRQDRRSRRWSRRSRRRSSGSSPPAATPGRMLVNNEKGEHYAAMGVRFLATAIMPWLSKGIREVKQQVGGR